MRNRAQEATAYHEAGHAIIALRQGLRVQKVTIEANRDSMGHCESRGFSRGELRVVEWGTITLKLRDRLEKQARTSLAGDLAQRRYNPRTWRCHHGGSDRQSAIELIRPLVGSDAELEAWIKLLQIQTEQMVKVRWFAIEAIAKRLCERRTLTGNEIHELLREAKASQIAKRDITRLARMGQEIA